MQRALGVFDTVWTHYALAVKRILCNIFLNEEIQINNRKNIKVLNVTASILGTI